MSTKSKLWYLENFNLFNEVCGKTMGHLSEKTTMKDFGKNEFIYFPEEPSKTIFFLKEGKVKIGSYSDDGKEIIKRILEPGDMFGELGLVGEEIRTDFAQTMGGNATICAMNLNDMEDMIKNNPEFGLRVTKFIGFKLRKVETRLESLVFKDARTRIIDFVRDLGEEKGTQVGTETLVKLNLTHQDIAKLTATSRQTVTTILNELKEKNLIFFDRKRILIRDLATFGNDL